MDEKGIKAVELVRRIREHLYEQLKGKSDSETIAFFQREAALANEEADALLRRRDAAGNLRADNEKQAA